MKSEAEIRKAIKNHNVTISLLPLDNPKMILVSTNKKAKEIGEMLK